LYDFTPIGQPAPASGIALAGAGFADARRDFLFFSGNRCAFFLAFSAMQK
jgi:hypothetical protein